MQNRCHYNCPLFLLAAAGLLDLDPGSRPGRLSIGVIPPGGAPRPHIREGQPMPRGLEALVLEGLN